MGVPAAPGPPSTPASEGAEGGAWRVGPRRRGRRLRLLTSAKAGTGPIGVALVPEGGWAGGGEVRSAEPQPEPGEACPRCVSSPGPPTVGVAGSGAASGGGGGGGGAGRRRWVRAASGASHRPGTSARGAAAVAAAASGPRAAGGSTHVPGGREGDAGGGGRPGPPGAGAGGGGPRVDVGEGRLRGRSRRRLTLTGVARAPFLGRPGLARRVLTRLVWVSNGGWQPAGLAACVRARGFGPARTRATAEWVPAGQGRRRVGAAGVGRGTGFPACAEAALARASPPLPEPARRPPPALLKLEG